MTNVKPDPQGKLEVHLEDAWAPIPIDDLLYPGKGTVYAVDRIAEELRLIEEAKPKAEKARLVATEFADPGLAGKKRKEDPEEWEIHSEKDLEVPATTPRSTTPVLSPITMIAKTEISVGDVVSVAPIEIVGYVVRAEGLRGARGRRWELVCDGDGLAD